MSQHATTEELLAAALANVASLEAKLRDALLSRRRQSDQFKPAEDISSLNQKLSAELASVTFEFDRLVESSKEIEAMLESDLAEAKKTISSLHIRIEQLTKQNQMSQSAQQQIPELQQQVQLLTTRNELLQKRLREVETENDMFDSKARKFETQYAKLVEVYNEQLQKVALLEAEMEDLKGLSFLQETSFIFLFDKKKN
jgi:DNA repair ATPase RecN